MAYIRVSGDLLWSAEYAGYGITAGPAHHIQGTTVYRIDVECQWVNIVVNCV